MANSDEYDPDIVDVMADFKGRSVLGAEERNAVIQEVKLTHSLPASERLRSLRIPSVYNTLIS